MSEYGCCVKWMAERDRLHKQLAKAREENKELQEQVEVLERAIRAELGGAAQEGYRLPRLEDALRREPAAKPGTRERR